MDRIKEIIEKIRFIKRTESEFRKDIGDTSGKAIVEETCDRKTKKK